MNKLVQLLLALIEMWEQFKAERKRKKRDELVQKARNDPTGAFGGHFSGVHDDKNNAADSDKASSSQTDRE